MKKFLMVTMLWFMTGCTTGTYVMKPDSLVASKPDVCNASVINGPDLIKDGDTGNYKIWTALNHYYDNWPGRKLVVFLDGTGNDKEDSSNIRVLYRLALEQSCHDKPVIPYYDRGVGAKWYDSVLGGGVGQGVSLNIRQAYRFLVSTYRPGDEIYIFGFSRGAFEARSLNGFIEFAGLLERNSIEPKWTDHLPRWLGSSSLHFIVEHVYDQYHVPHDGTNDFEPKLKKRIHDYEQSEYKNLQFVPVKVKGIGVFDTVPALGIFSDEEPDNHRIDLYADYGFHALSIDEQRNKFKLNRFNELVIKPGQMLKEVWFPGVHANIGGGYAKTIGCNTTNSNEDSYYDGLETTSLNWMMANFATEGLFSKLDKPFPECRNGRLHDEFFDNSKLYKKMGISRRKPHDGDAIHESVVERTTLPLIKPNAERECLQKDENGKCSAIRYLPQNLKFPLEQKYRIERTSM